MLSDFIQHTLAQVDDLNELKVSLVALQMLGQKQIEVASITERELLSHPAIRDGLKFPNITLKPALQLAVARGVLLCAEIADEPRYFLNNESSRRAVESLQNFVPSNLQTPTTPSTMKTLSMVGREIERLELTEFYDPQLKDIEWIEEWLAQGYTQDEIVSAIRVALRAPRPKNTPSRTLIDCAGVLTANEPAKPSDYYNMVVAKKIKPSEEIVNLQLRLNRKPNGHEFNLVRTAVGMFGLRATLDVLKRVSQAGVVDVDALIPLLAEQEEAELALSRKQVAPDLQLRELAQLYEANIGLPPTTFIVEEMKVILNDVPSLDVWRGAFETAGKQNKKDWRYIRTVLRDLSPSVHVPDPINPTATFAFEMYRHRISRNKQLAPVIAHEINEIALTETDESKWEKAFQDAERAEAKNWNYIRTIMKGGGTKSKQGRKPKTTYTDADHVAALERARQQLEKITKRNAK
jgi:hypothetical protein